MIRMARRTFMTSGAAALATATELLPPFCIGARAQSSASWPTRPVRFVVPLAAGGGLDFVARVVAEYLSRSLGLQVVTENRTGGGGTIAFETVAKSPPDGYSALVTNDNIVSAPYILKLPMDYGKDLVPVIQLARQPLALAVHPALGVSSVAELVRVLKARPGQGCATSGAGSNQHVLLEWFASMSGVQLDHVPYRGAGQAINDLLAGHVRIAFLGPTALIPHFRSGSVLILAQSGATRSSSLAEVPTLQEAGLPGMVLESWYGVFLPAGTPSAIVSRLNGEIAKALADEASRETLLKTATEPTGGTPEQFAHMISEDSEKYSRLAQELKFSIN
ncbi:MAG: Bug family tripartite tricarboxylate transporter substrate binding protein [Xanthobacteraceae bacterium]